MNMNDIALSVVNNKLDFTHSELSGIIISKLFYIKSFEGTIQPYSYVYCIKAQKLSNTGMFYSKLVELESSDLDVNDKIKELLKTFTGYVK